MAAIYGVAFIQTPERERERGRRGEKEGKVDQDAAAGKRKLKSHFNISRAGYTVRHALGHKRRRK